ncbi:MAG: hypothetical protein Q9217_003848 [Psora testacea]
MRFVAILQPLLVARALASPVLDIRHLPEGVATRRHNHFEFHRLRARDSVAARDTPAEDMLEEMDKSFGESQGTGPSDDWRNPDEVIVQAQKNHKLDVSTPPSHHSQPVQENVVYVTTTCETNNEPSQQPKPQTQAQGKLQTEGSTPPSPLPQQVKENVVYVTSTYVIDNQPSQEPKPQAQAQKQPQQPPAKQVQQSEPQPEPQSQPEIYQEQTQAKPQPTNQEPAASPSPGSSGISTDGLPRTFVPDLEPEDAIYQGLAKLHHDIHRQNHSVRALEWNETLLEYAKETAKSCIFAHSMDVGGGGYGQNIAAGYAPGNISAQLTNKLYNDEIVLFQEALGGVWGNDQPDMTNRRKWGHATQMLWRDTTSFACYTATCHPPGADPLACDSSGQSYVKNVACGNGGTMAYNTVCNYYPPGNHLDKYSAVLAPTNKIGFVQMTQHGITGL